MYIRTCARVGGAWCNIIYVVQREVLYAGERALTAAVAAAEFRATQDTSGTGWLRSALRRRVVVVVGRRSSVPVRARARAGGSTWRRRGARRCTRRRRRARCSLARAADTPRHVLHWSCARSTHVHTRRRVYLLLFLLHHRIILHYTVPFYRTIFINDGNGRHVRVYNPAHPPPDHYIYIHGIYL